jgi:hypothetical protein
MMIFYILTWTSKPHTETTQKTEEGRPRIASGEVLLLILDASPTIF